MSMMSTDDLEYAIDGMITCLKKEEFLRSIHQIRRNGETITILKNPNRTRGVEKEVEIALRLKGCDRIKTFHLSQVYWSKSLCLEQSFLYLFCNEIF